MLARVKAGVQRLLRTVGTLLLVVLAVGLYGWSLGKWSPFSLWKSPTASPTTGAAAASPPPAAPATNSLRIGVDDRAACLPFSAVSEFLEGDARNLHIQIVPVADAEMRWQMLAAGRLEMACGTLDSYTVAAARFNVGSIIFKIGTSSGDDMLVSTPDIANVRALAGKKAAVVSGGPGAYLLGYFLDRQSMSPSEVQTVSVDDVQDAARLLEAGKVSAAWVWEPWGQNLASRGFKVLTTSAEHDIVQDVCVANAASLKGDTRAMLQSFMKGWFGLINLLNANPGLAKDLIARHAHVRPAVAGMLLSDVHFADLNENKRLDANAIGERMKRIIEFFKFTGEAPNMSRPIDYAQSVAADLVNEVEVAAPTSIFGRPTGTPSPAPDGGDAP